MEFTSGLHFAGAVIEISVLDLMLSADNALVIAMCCSALPAAHARRAVFLGTAGAIAFRTLLTAVAGLLLQIAYLKIIAALVLAIIAIRLIVANGRGDDGERDAVRSPGAAEGTKSQRGAKTAAWRAVAAFVAADAIMSLDNIVALAAVAQGSVLLLIFGLLLSIPLLVLGGLLVLGLLKRHPFLVTTGGAILGWIAGEIALTDPAIANWAANEAPALSVVVPLLSVVLVLWESRIIRSADRRGAARAHGGRDIAAPSAMRKGRAATRTSQ